MASALLGIPPGKHAAWLRSGWCFRANLNEIAVMSQNALEFLAEIWRQEPSLIIFLVVGVVVFAGLVVDSHRLHRERRIRQRTGLY
jgi:hypothetical protein